MYVKVKILPNSGLPAWKDMTRLKLVEVVTGYVFHVTGYHHVVGNVAEYLMNPQVSDHSITQSLTHSFTHSLSSLRLESNLTLK